MAKKQTRKACQKLAFHLVFKAHTNTFYILPTMHVDCLCTKKNAYMFSKLRLILPLNYTLRI